MVSISSVCLLHLPSATLTNPLLRGRGRDAFCVLVQGNLPQWPIYSSEDVFSVLVQGNLPQWPVYSSEDAFSVHVQGNLPLWPVYSSKDTFSVRVQGNLASSSVASLFVRRRIFCSCTGKPSSGANLFVRRRIFCSCTGKIPQWLVYSSEDAFSVLVQGIFLYGQFIRQNMHFLFVYKKTHFLFLYRNRTFSILVQGNLASSVASLFVKIRIFCSSTGKPSSVASLFVRRLENNGLQVIVDALSASAQFPYVIQTHKSFKKSADFVNRTI